ncbi:MAG: 2,3-bisphosphoglycerate-independent phosphoglycerate mutase [Candidatus Moranbacteria bacterium]|nr:2,3-bisphosphoglycerate-independent phosphoglycerate mutase [Candidatus Moranbacteria bacterium]
MKTKTPNLAVILDGFGMGPKYPGNAIELAVKPTFDYLKKRGLYTELTAHGQAVGLNRDQISGSEVGHMNIGCGRVIKQEVVRINEAIENGQFFKNQVFLELIAHLKKFSSSLHLIGLLSQKDSPHSNFLHFKALLELAKRNSVKKVFVHFFTDGRDSSPKSAKRFLDKWAGAMQQIGIGQIASIGGRFYGMDRTKNWKRLKKAYNAIVFGKGKKANCAAEAIDKAYQNGLTDEFIPPTTLVSDNEPIATVNNQDGVVFFHLRSDRARQLTKLFVLDESKETKLPKPRLKNLKFVTLTGFGPKINVKTAYNNFTTKITLVNNLKKIRQLYVAETEKFAHITYFFNGQHSEVTAGEDRIMAPSVKVDNYAKVPKMSAGLITNQVVQALNKSSHDFILINFANPDMLGHTGDIKATVKGLEFVDQCLARLFKIISKKKGNLFIFSDHGNAERMLNEKTGEKVTFHTANPVPFIFYSHKRLGRKLAQGGQLSNVAPTILEVLEIDQYNEMDKSLW